MALNYWPNKKGIQLNQEVANLLLITKKKVALNVHKFTEYYLYTDILDQTTRKKLFLNVLNQLENLILDIIEIDLDLESLKLLNYKIICDLVKKSSINFLDTMFLDDNIVKIIKSNTASYSKIITYEHKLLLENLLIYLIFGSDQINDFIYAFNNKQTPKQHIYIILDNFIIQISNIVIQLIFHNINSLPRIVAFVVENKICNALYISKRSVAIFINNLLWQNFLYLHIQQPKDIYSNRYRVWFIYNKGLYAKYIYVSRLNNTLQLSYIQKILIYIIEIQDIIIPKLEKKLLALYKIILYVLINILGNTTIFIIRTLVSSFQNNYKQQNK